MQILTSLLDILFPPRANERVLRHCTALPASGGYFGNIEYLSSFQTPVVRATVTENKFHNNRRARTLLANLLSAWAEKQPKPLTIIPIPLSLKRQKERGFNQVYEVVQTIAQADTKINATILERNKHTQPQTNLTKDERRKNVRAAFVVDKGENFAELSNHTVVLIDDVVTTGATLHEARATLAPHLPTTTKIICLALAH